MKVKLRLRKEYQNKMIWDPDTNNTWTGKEIIESEITPFVAKALAKNVLEEVKTKESIEEKKQVEYGE